MMPVLQTIQKILYGHKALCNEHSPFSTLKNMLPYSPSSAYISSQMYRIGYSLCDWQGSESMPRPSPFHTQRAPFSLSCIHSNTLSNAVSNVAFFFNCFRCQRPHTQQVCRYGVTSVISKTAPSFLLQISKHVIVIITDLQLALNVSHFLPVLRVLFYLRPWNKKRR